MSNISKKLLCSFLLLLLGASTTLAQMLPAKGVPLLRNFTPAQYDHKGKIWDIRSAPNGMIYMAADRGLLEYDGKTWNSFKGSNGFTRSLLVINDSLIFTGSDLDFGVWKKNIYQCLEYHSLYPFQEVTQDVSEEFWDIHQQHDDILFVSSQNIYVYKNKSRQLIRIAAPSSFVGSFQVNDTLYFADKKRGLYIFDGFSLKKVFEYPENIMLNVIGIYQHDNELLLVTRDSGLYHYAAGKLNRINNTLSERLKIAKVFSFERIGTTYLAFGTILKGVYISDLKGDIIHHINRYKGLPSNTILSLHYSPTGKLWLGMDYGISVLNLKSNITAFYDYRGDFGTGYTALLKDDLFYLGTNQGLYRAEWEALNNNVEFFKFQLLPNTEGQVWTLENIDNSLLMGHDKGLFVVQNNTIEKIGIEEGIWTIVPYKSFLLTGNYNGISIFKKTGTKWTFLKKMELILGSCNQLIIEENTILWVNIPNFGIIRAVLDNDLKPTDRLIFPEATFEGNTPTLLKDEQGIHVLTNQFHYTFDAANKKFIKKTLVKITFDTIGRLPGTYRALHDDYVFHSTYNGFLLQHFQSDDAQSIESNPLIFRQITAFNNDKKIALAPNATVPYQFNNFRIEYIIPNSDEVLYQYKANDSDAWSLWTPDNTVELIGLKYGKYTLQVRAKIAENISNIYTVTLRIAAPWYSSWYAFVAYAALFVLAGYAIMYWRKQSLEKQKAMLLLQEQEALRQQAKEHQQEILLLEQARLRMEYDQLKQQLRTKTIELAKKAKENEEKNRLLLTLKEKYEAAQEDPSVSKYKWKEMERLLDSYLKVEDKTFEIQMDELYQAFFKKLKDRFPGLSNNDLRLCAYLRAGISSKEIAEIFNIQPSSFYISRSRLRKKLKLEMDENLYDFLNAI
jgi:hypothetical protein